MLETIIASIKSLETKDTSFRKAILKMAKENLVYICGDKRYSNSRVSFAPCLYKDLPEDTKEAVEAGRNFIEYTPKLLDKTNKLLKQDPNYKMWKTIFCQENPEASIFSQRISFFQLEHEEITYSSYSRERNGTTIKLKKYQAKLMLLLLNKNGTFNIFKISESKTDLTQKTSYLTTFDSDIKEYDSGISSNFYPINTALFLEGLLKSEAPAFQEKIKAIATANPASTFASLYNFVIEQPSPLSEKLEQIFDKLNLGLHGKFFVTKKEAALTEIRNIPITYQDPYASYYPLNIPATFRFEAKTRYRTEVRQSYSLTQSAATRLEFTSEKPSSAPDSKREAMYGPLFPAAIALDATLGFGVKFEEAFLYEEQALRTYCKQERFTASFTTAIINMFINLKSCVLDKIASAEKIMEGVENIYEYENLFIDACKEIDELNIAPMKTTYLLNQI
jgi:hypothetical protein